MSQPTSTIQSNPCHLDHDHWSLLVVRIDLVEFELDGGSKIDKPCDRDSVTVRTPLLSLKLRFNLNRIPSGPTMMFCWMQLLITRQTFSTLIVLWKIQSTLLRHSPPTTTARPTSQWIRSGQMRTNIEKELQEHETNWLTVINLFCGKFVGSHIVVVVYLDRQSSM